MSIGFTAYEANILNSHIKDLTISFEDFKQEPSKFQESSIKFNHDIVKLLKTLDGKLIDGLEKVQCETGEIIAEILHHGGIERWETLLRDLFASLERGSRTGYISPTVINKQALEELVSQIPALNKTLYKKHPELLLRTGKQTLIDMDRRDGTFNVHLVLSAPALNEKLMFPIYKVNQVGFLNNGTCVKMKLPEFVYKKEGQFYEADLSECEDRGLLRLCLQNEILNSNNINSEGKVACLKGNTVGCKLLKWDCHTRFNFHKAGLLLFTNDSLRMSQRNESKNNWLIPYMGNQTTQFLSWEDYDLIVIGNLIITALDYVVTEIRLEVDSWNIWESFLDKEATRLASLDVTELYLVGCLLVFWPFFRMIEGE